jgi:hypothetical protein
LGWLLRPAPEAGRSQGGLVPPGEGTPDRSRERGFALVIGLVAMAALTVLGVAAVTSSSIDLKIAHNMQRLNQAKYAAIAGVEHARRNMVLGIMPSQAQTAYFDDPAATPAAYISSTDAIKMQTADGVQLGTYTVTAVAVKCGGPPAGYSVDLFYSQFFDLRSTGVINDASGAKLSPATAGAALTVRKVQDGRCYKR